MEAQLQEYRALRRRKALEEKEKEELEEIRKLADLLDIMDQRKEEEKLLLNEDIDSIIDATSETSEVESLENENKGPWGYFTIKWTAFLIIWLAFYIYFLRLQFGAVFFVFSVLIGIYFNTRTRPKKAGEVSAYSVFNENCASIEGTLTAEQFEREIRFGPGSV